MSFLRKFLKNKVLVLSICVIIVSLVYKGVQKAIDSYNFNNGIVSTDGVKEVVKVDNQGNHETSYDLESITQNEQGEFAEEEIDLVLEEIESSDINTKEDDKKIKEEMQSQSKIYVYVTGEVNVPGVVVLDEGSRIVDAINAAGGTTSKADISKVNLVYILDDGMKVNIPNNTDLKNNNDFEYITMNSGDGGNDYYSRGDSSSKAGVSSEKITETDDGNVAGVYTKKYDIVNINTATQTELETLPGIGPSLALKIINYRKENGKFSSIEQIKDVSGIGESKFENLRSFITI